jgi:hypothetical protein
VAYSPDFTFRRLLAEKKITLHDNTLIRKLVLDDAKPVIVAAQGVNSEHPADSVEYRASALVIVNLRGNTFQCPPARPHRGLSG